MRFWIFIVFVSFFFHCSKPPSVSFDPYFQYDEVEHLNTDKDDDWMSQLERKKVLTLDEERTRNLLSDPFDRQLSDTSNFDGIERLGYSRSKIAEDKFPALDQIFGERHYNSFRGTITILGEVTECLPVYRDILIFKKKNKTVGFGRVCFSCGQAIIVGTTKDTESFGWSGDYARLAELLK